MILIENPNQLSLYRLPKIQSSEYFPLPNIKEYVDKVVLTKYITLFDLACGYWQIPLILKAQKLAAFIISFGSYILLHMSFHLKNSPYFFRKVMSKTLKNCEIYMFLI